ncbi:hypothetical protein [Marinobacter orientalis]|uniref:Lipoprotein n=1 Tax=Marinobacter orientalis TaxID=1928859 RepID=A0A7Y0RBB8_9GAMM|nr:hypothetical protein [Marinobacter orientalis]NMT63094.1 hypothetical protein [Marinobacter orientalis]TGX51753.1 hypothetical protein DIT72_06980 [Marinobacter orientalis]
MDAYKCNVKTVVAGLAMAMLAAGCASPSSEDQFGNSVRQMIAAQKYVSPDREVPELPVLDGRKAEAGYESYRKDTGNPSRMTPDMSGSVGLGLQR